MTTSLASTADLIEEGKQCRSSTCVIRVWKHRERGGMEFCGKSRANCET